MAKSNNVERVIILKVENVQSMFFCENEDEPLPDLYKVRIISLSMFFFTQKLLCTEA